MPRATWGRAAGYGRVKGTPNKITARQREVAAMVLGEPGTPEFAEFVAAERKAALEQSMAPAIKSLWMHYLLGIPKVSVEVKDTTNDLDDLSTEELRARSMAVAATIVQLQAPVEEREAVQ